MDEPEINDPLAVEESTEVDLDEKDEEDEEDEEEGSDPENIASEEKAGEEMTF